MTVVLDQIGLQAVVEMSAFYGEIEGEQIDVFEGVLASLTGFERCVATSSESGAISVMIGALGLQPGDRVIVSPALCYRNIFALLHAGIELIYTDFSPTSFLPNLEEIAERLLSSVKAVIVSLPWGYPESLAGLRSLTSANLVPLVLDITNFLGPLMATPRLAADCDVAVLSMAEGRSDLSLGEGGAIFFRDVTLAAKAKSYTRFSDLDGVHLGINQKLSPVQATFGLERLKALPKELSIHQQDLCALSENISTKGIAVLCPSSSLNGIVGGAVVACRAAVANWSGECQFAYLELSNRLPTLRQFARDCPNAHATAARWCGVSSTFVGRTR
ncbi:DegT/DnrJ/EryC1/StrS aminotransferase family protein [Rhizobium sp. CFBP 8762]|uniref:DegT/DnrJ/EryC1/StrS family aminotransferase n=1 Tax=Rhizobium sp. CFBP 8762 TaxID=2775279 RepID=UPI0017805A79|nr:DegT/DnrJ/EryC1/StrS family aminotransferase [Rhizobium sp. CFBP 8762]MBD8555175.1 DegT/DnrJ/EryC1/StrS aminotransferase family protein [Rhizobium sp. CFBP 8762]